ncbi:glucose-6-phosphate isomerase [Legionella dresdenensis]|uniref:Glucose-6-phosphate isomerase n=1 Tax=Legionella dresdenensis TaxID=450200 RepID=A0ABV8CDB5_9GAMM
MMQLTELGSWKLLEQHAHKMRVKNFGDPDKSDNTLSFVSHKNIQIDFSYQCANRQTLALLVALANERNLKNKIKQLFHGELVNQSEQKPALHTALRAMDNKPLLVDGKDIMPAIFDTRAKIANIAERMNSGRWIGYSGKAITDIVNIGIGGSDLGPRFCMKALSDLTNINLRYHFISDVDPNAFGKVVKYLNPETTLFIIASKSFTTRETLYNAKKALAWINQPFFVDRHFIAVTANAKKAHETGINNVLPIWDWVGGRYSSCSAINLITAIAIGHEQFMELLAGANSMDHHFYNTEFDCNLPVLLALFGIWNNNFLHIHNLLMLAYAQQLEYFIPFIQQIDMESNGKSVDNSRRSVNYATGPMIWGGLGNQAQHSYFQLLCQGTHRLTVDFITMKSYDQYLINQMCAAKMGVLSQGVYNTEKPDYCIPGNIPLNNIILADCTPFTIGQLIALYEHKIYVQSVIWDINPFDQPGVESAKQHTLLKSASELN